MPRVTFINENLTAEVPAGTTIADAARQVGLTVETPCGGAGTCGKCRVIVSDLKAVEIMDSVKKLTDQDLRQGLVMACQTRIRSDLEVKTRPDPEKDGSLQILAEGRDFRVAVDSRFRKEYDEKSNITSIFLSGIPIESEQGDSRGRLYGVTVDIGTTTLVTALIDFNTGREVDSISALNPQCKYAQDVVSRINYSSHYKDGLQTLFEAVRDEINQMIGKLCDRNGIRREWIYEAVYSGNTTMLHLATMTDPYSLGQYPYTPVIEGGQSLLAKECGLEISRAGRVYLPPIISSYVGADISSGVLACSIHRQAENILFIDIGTNGEMVLSINGKMSACSTAAGPAFEGMNITFGMRAGSGAIESFEIDSDYEMEVKTIGNEPAKGICGSGLFDLVGELVRIGLIEKSGRFVKPEKSALPEKLLDRIGKYEGKTAFHIDNGVYLTLLDIRQIQLAKSALRAGIEAMLGLQEVDVSDIDEVYIAGSFGYHLKPKSLVNIGILSGELEDRIRFVGNTSKTGGTALLLNEGCREELLDIVKNIKTLELSQYPDFESLFVKSMNFW
ncbi:MAG: ASKHA domain-containing protein [Lachnospiraceae bacterium]|nr:ASKHA domain-containing protein [Lachnospiraceae bacterium]